jgi:aminoglycoside phosphotransferase (APT) family kinase protein
VFVATTRSGPTHVVKQAGPRSALTLQRESEVLRLLADAPALNQQVPTVVHEDRDMALLVLRSPGGGLDWREHHRSGRFPIAPARALGRSLAALHGLHACGLQGPAESDRTWGLTITDPSHELMLGLSSAAQDLVARLQANPAITERLERVRDGGGYDTLVHGDLRWDNCLAFASPGSRRRTRVLLVDWELAGRGESALDVGSVLAEYLSAWVGSIPIVEMSDPGRLLSHAKYPLGHMHKAIDAFWSAYQGATALPPTLSRVMEMAAVRILETAIEYAQMISAPSAHLVTLLQLADNVLQQPERAALILLGLRE